MRYDYQKLKDFGTKVMISAGLEKEEAVLFMENLLYADSRGVGSHGISRLINYAKRRPKDLIEYLTDDFNLTKDQAQMYFGAAMAQ